MKAKRKSEPGPAQSGGRACHECARPLGSEPTTARLSAEGGTMRAVEICAACAGTPAEKPAPASVSVACSACGEPAPATGVAVAAGAQIAVLCRPCASGKPASSPPAPPSSPPRTRRRRARRIGAAAAIVALAATGYSLRDDEPKSASATPSLLDATTNAARAEARERGATEVRVPPRERPQVHDLSFANEGGEDDPLVWYHPLARERSLPTHAGRQFGAERPGQRPEECEAGHCGVDLGEQSGRVVHAVRPGLVDRVVRTPGGLSGKYVRLYHPEGFFTDYMHLDVVRPDIVPGMEVAAGDALGLLGSTGIQHSPPHLHFAVSVLRDSGAQHHLDPEPMLRQAVVLDEPAPFPERWRKRAPRLARASRAPRAPERTPAAEKLDEGAAAAEEGESAGKSGDEVAEPREGVKEGGAAEAADEGARGEAPPETSAPDGDSERAVGIEGALDEDLEGDTPAGAIDAVGAAPSP